MFRMRNIAMKIADITNLYIRPLVEFIQSERALRACLLALRAICAPRGDIYGKKMLLLFLCTNTFTQRHSERLKWHQT